MVVYDAASKMSFQMRTVLLMTVTNFSACSNLSSWSGQGYLACPSCNDASPSKQITSKIYYVGHRQWLPVCHRMRNNKNFDCKVDRQPLPPQKSGQQILAQLENVGPRLLSKHEKYGSKKRKRHPMELN